MAVGASQTRAGSADAPVRRRSVHPATWTDRLTPADRRALWWWASTRLLTYWVAAIAPWLLSGDGATPGAYLPRWQWWDVAVFEKIAQYGYDGPPDQPGHYTAFFPGLPMVLRALHTVGLDWTLAGLLVSFVAGAVAVVALSRITELDLGPGTGWRAAAALSVCPLTVFLTAGYSESLFLGLALPAWLAARRSRWLAASVLAAGACLVRIGGLYLVVALGVLFLTEWWRRRGAGGPRLVQAGWFVLPVLAVFSFVAYLHARTGQWDAYLVAQRDGWGRQWVGVRQTWLTMYSMAQGYPGRPDWAMGARLEIAAVAVGLVLGGYLLLRRRLAESAYVLIPVLSLLPMAMYASAGRTLLTWWPLWTVIAALSASPRMPARVVQVALGLSATLAVLLTAAFVTGRWAG